MNDEEFRPRLTVEELLERYAAGERKFTMVDLSGADLGQVDFGYRSLRGLVYNRRIDFSYSDLREVNLRDANLHEAVMELVDLSDACLAGVRLDYARLEGARLINANLRGANIGSTTFDGADFTGADLTYASWGFSAKDALLKNTIMPDGNIFNS
jgi:uncharacterized protein YjbI with pentapeptide repeats